MSQVQYFLNLIRKGQVHDNDIVYFADFWTPGLESIFYALDLYKIKNVKLKISINYPNTFYHGDCTKGKIFIFCAFLLGLNKRSF